MDEKSIHLDVNIDKYKLNCFNIFIVDFSPLEELNRNEAERLEKQAALLRTGLMKSALDGARILWAEQAERLRNAEGADTPEYKVLEDYLGLPLKNYEPERSLVLRLRPDPSIGTVVVGVEEMQVFIPVPSDVTISPFGPLPEDVPVPDHLATRYTSPAGESTYYLVTKEAVTEYKNESETGEQIFEDRLTDVGFVAKRVDTMLEFTGMISELFTNWSATAWEDPV